MNAGTSVSEKLLFLFMAVAIIYGLYKAHKKEIVLFSSYTDFVMSLLVLGLPLGVGLILHGLLGLSKENIISKIIMYISFLLPLALVIINTKRSNDGWVSFLLSIGTKVFMLAAIFFVFMYYWAISSKDQGEDESNRAYERRMRENAVKAAAISATVLPFLFYFGLEEPVWVSLDEYIFGEEEQERVARTTQSPARSAAQTTPARTAPVSPDKNPVRTGGPAPPKVAGRTPKK